MLERIGHEFRMRNERLTKAVVLGWLEELERWEREVKEENRKKREDRKILYWKRI